MRCANCDGVFPGPDGKGLCMECENGLDAMESAHASYAKHFSKPLAAAEADLLGEALKLLHKARHMLDLDGEIAGAGLQIVGVEDEIDSFLAKVKE